jgi:hypothetical protein
MTSRISPLKHLIGKCKVTKKGQRMTIKDFLFTMSQTFC